MTDAELCASVREVFAQTIARLDPARRVCDALERRPIDERGVIVLAAGKAAPAMARGATAALGARVRAGLVVSPEGSGEVPEGLEAMRAAHPIPDDRSLAAGRAVLEFVRAARASERVLALISGGASALLCLPTAGLSLADKVAATSAVMAAGAPIDELNAVRKHLSAIKGGRLAAASPAPVTTLALSDVLGDQLAAIASGPTVPDPTTFADACRAVEASCGMTAIPAAARDHLEAGRRGERDETPKRARAGDRAEIIAGTGALVDEAIAAARDRDGGAEAEELSRGIDGDVSEVAEMLASAARRARKRAAASGRPVWFVAGGEPTVRLPSDPGEGGRAHQLALLVAERIAGIHGVVVLAAGSDGIDGSARGAGAIVTGATWKAIGEAGFDPADALRRFDAAPALAAVGAQIITGPTGVNHADLILVAAIP